MANYLDLEVSLDVSTHASGVPLVPRSVTLAPWKTTVLACRVAE